VSFARFVLKVLRTALALAEDNFVFERLLVSGYGAYVMYFCSRLAQFYYDLPGDQRESTQVTAFVTVLITAITGLSAPVLAIYTKAQNQWAARKGIRLDSAV
jgi:uncharacterized membrane protein YidH (DUF202 family)